MLHTGYSVQETIRFIEQDDLLRVGELALRDTGGFTLRWLSNSRWIRDGAYQSGDEGERYCASTWGKVEKSESYRSLATVGNIDIKPLLERRLKFFFDEVVPSMSVTFEQMLTLFRELKPVAILGTTMSWSTKTVFEAAKSVGVPTIVYRHGASAGYVMMDSVPPFIHYQNELRWSDYVFTYGEGDNQYYDTFYPQKKARTIAIGSAVLDSLRRNQYQVNREEVAQKYGLDPDRPIAIYCPTAMDGNMRAAPYRSRSPGRGFEIERAIADVAGEVSHVQFIFKLHASSPYWPVSPIVEYIRDKQIENCIVMTADFKKLLPLANLFITDYPSTTFLEMLVTKTPIIVCGYLQPFPFSREVWHPSCLEMWRERVDYHENLDSFLQSLRTYLMEGYFDSVESNDDMLKLFGTHLDDGNSARRAADKIVEIAKIWQ